MERNENNRFRLTIVEGIILSIGLFLALIYIKSIIARVLISDHSKLVFNIFPGISADTFYLAQDIVERSLVQIAWNNDTFLRDLMHSL